MPQCNLLADTCRNGWASINRSLLFYMDKRSDLLEGFHAGVREHVDFQIGFVLKHFPAAVASAGPHDVLVVNFFHVPLKGCTGPEDFKAALALKIFEHLSHVRMHPFDVDFELLRLTKLASAQVAQRPAPLRIFRTPVSSMHFQIIEP